MRVATLIVGIVLLAGSTSFAQTSSSDMSNLERKYQEAQQAVTANASTAREDQLRDLRDELGYLRVRSRRGATVTMQERRDLSARFDRFIADVNADRTSNYRNDRNYPGNDRTYPGADRNYPSADRSGRTSSGSTYQREIPSGTEVDIRLQTRLDSHSSEVEDKVEGTTLTDLYQGNDLLIPAGSLMTGYVSAVEKATRTDRKGSINVNFTRVSINGRSYEMKGSITEALESEGIKGEVGKIGAGAGVGAIIGGILGGAKGALAGILIGGGGVIAATDGKDVEVPIGSTLRVRFDQAVPISR